MTGGEAVFHCLMIVNFSRDQARPRPRCVLGAINCYGSEGPSFKVLAINVTVLTRERLHEVLIQAGDDQAAVIALQETRHPANGFRWAAKVTSDAGWRIQWSAPPNPNRAGTQLGAGGTALLWRRELGRGTACAFDAPQDLKH